MNDDAKIADLCEKIGLEMGLNSSLWCNDAPVSNFLEALLDKIKFRRDCEK